MNAVIDTNVLVSALLNPQGAPGELLRLVARGSLVPLFDHRILAEYEEVLGRGKFGFLPRDVGEFLGLFSARGLKVDAPPMPNVCADPDDMPFYEVALAGKAAALITGNLKDYPKRPAAGLKILGPAEFMEKFVLGEI